MDKTVPAPLDDVLQPCAPPAEVQTLLPRVAVAEVEEVSTWEAHRIGVIQSVNAEGPLQVALAERIALLIWRLARVARSEAELVSLQQEKVEGDYASRRKHDPHRPATSPCHPEDIRGELDDHEKRLHLLKRFPKLEDQAPLSGLDASTILWTLAATADVDLEDHSLPGIPDDAVLEEVPGWTAGKVRACVEAIAAVNPDDPAELLQISLESEERQLRLARYEVERMQRDLARTRRERLLPDVTTLEKHSRYEAHLSRELTNALRELQTLQERGPTTGKSWGHSVR